MSEKIIFIDKNTSFNGSIEANQVIVIGMVKGDIIASDKVLIKSGGMVNGTIDTDVLLFEEGGKHDGLIRLGDGLAESDNSQNMSQLFQSQSDEQIDQVEDTSEAPVVKKELQKIVVNLFHSR